MESISGLMPLPASTGEELGLDRFVGKVPVTLTFAGRAESPVTAEVVRGFDEHLSDFGATRVQALIVVSSGRTELELHLSRGVTTVPVLADKEGVWRTHFGVAVGTDDFVTTVLLDADGQLVERLMSTPGGVHAEEVLAMVDAWLADVADESAAGLAGPHSADT